MKVLLNEYEPKEVIRFVREWVGLTQKEFGATINKSERTIRDYESGKSRYSIETLKLVAKVHDIKITIEKSK